MSLAEQYLANGKLSFTVLSSDSDTLDILKTKIEQLRVELPLRQPLVRGYLQGQRIPWSATEAIVSF